MVYDIYNQTQWIKKVQSVMKNKTNYVTPSQQFLDVPMEI